MPFQQIDTSLSLSQFFVHFPKGKLGGEVGVKVRVMCKSRICMFAENVIHHWDTEHDACACVIVRGV